MIIIVDALITQSVMMLGEEKIHCKNGVDDDNSNGDVIDDDIGTRVASFYLSLRTIQSNLGTSPS